MDCWILLNTKLNMAKHGIDLRNWASHLTHVATCCNLWPPHLEQISWLTFRSCFGWILCRQTLLGLASILFWSVDKSGQHTLMAWPLRKSYDTNSYNHYCRYATLPELGQFPRAGSCAGLFPLAEMVIYILAMLLWYVDEKSTRKAQEMLDLETKRHGFRMIQVCILDSILKISDAWMVLNHHILSWHSTTFSWELLFQVWVYNYCP
jgi:hypothetical protein